MAAIGWVADLASANAYFLGERLESPYWDALISTTGGRDEKTAVLNMAYNRLRFCREFSIPTTPTADQGERLKIAQLETAYYLAQHLADEDTRKGLHAQGVVGAGIVQETYVRFNADTVHLLDVHIPPIVYQLLKLKKAKLVIASLKLRLMVVVSSCGSKAKVDWQHFSGQIFRGVIA